MQNIVIINKKSTSVNTNGITNTVFNVHMKIILACHQLWDVCVDVDFRNTQKDPKINVRGPPNK